VTHQPVSVVSQCSLIAWLNGLASGDEHRLTGNSSALEACLRRCAIQMAAFTLLCLSETAMHCDFVFSASGYILTYLFTYISTYHLHQQLSHTSASC